MRVYISCDIEGVAGITNWDEARKTHADYAVVRYAADDYFDVLRALSFLI